MIEFAGRGAPLSAGGVAAAADLLGISPEALWTVVMVETAGCGFLPDRRPRILFERHEFRRRTGGRFDESHPEISGKLGGYGAGGVHQHDRMAVAIGCDRRAALESASWGLGQLMGYNAALCGHPDAESLIARCCDSEDEQLIATARFIKSRKLDAALARGDWAAFARGYNGPGYAANQYDTKLAAAYKALLNLGMPDFDLRAVQLMLTYEGYDVGPIDGRAGARTRGAIAKYRASRSLPPGETVDAALLAALGSPPSAVEPARSGVDRRAGQKLLAALGFDPGPLDGLDGPRTRQAFTLAIEDGLPTGELDARLTATLSHPEAARELRRLVQSGVGMTPNDVDGIWGPRSQSAADAFCRTYRLGAKSGIHLDLVGGLLRHQMGSQ